LNAEDFVNSLLRSRWRGWRRCCFLATSLPLGRKWSWLSIRGGI